MKIGFGGVLFLVFLVLKLTETIDWSWWWVTAPLWGVAVLVVVVLISAALWALYDDARQKRDPKYALRRSLEQMQEALRRK